MEPGTQRETARSIYETITEIDRRFDEFTREFDAGYSQQRDILQSTISRAGRNGDDFTFAAARKELSKLNKMYYRKRRAKFTYILNAVCKRNGRSVDAIVKIAGYNYRTKSIRTS